MKQFLIIYEEDPPRGDDIIELEVVPRIGELVVLKDKDGRKAALVLKDNGRKAAYRVDLVTHEPGRLTKLNVHFNHYTQ